MATSPINLTSGLVPKPTGGIDLSAGLVSKPATAPSVDLSGGLVAKPQTTTATPETLWGKIGGAISDIVSNPEKAVSTVFGTNPAVTEAAAKQFQQPGIANKVVGGTEWLVSGVPWAGANLAKGMQEAGQGKYKQSAIHTAEGAAQAATLPFIGEKAASEIAGHEAEEYLPEAGQALRKAKQAILNVKTASVPAGSAIATLTKGAAVPEVRVVGTDAEKAELESTPEQSLEDWFGKSKITDAEGKPLRVYHGTRAPEDFTEFRTTGPEPPEGEEESTYAGSYGDPTAYLGAHFAKEPEVAGKFAAASENWMQPRTYEAEAAGQTERPRMIPAFLKMENPKDFGSEQNLRNFIYRGDLQKAGYGGEELLNAAMEADGIQEPENGDSPGEEEWLKKYEDDPDFRETQNRWLFEDYRGSDVDADQRALSEAAPELASQARAKLQEQGFDGVTYKNEVEGGTGYVVFEPHQAKFALTAMAKVVPKDYVPVVSQNEILSDAIQKTIDNSKILQTASLDPGEIYSSADVEKQLNQAADALRSNLDSRATIPLTFTMQKQLASDLGMSVEDLLSRKSGTAFNAEEVSAARALLKESQTKVMNLARLAASGDEDYVRQFNEALAQHKTILDTVKGRVAKEAGRALGAFRIAEQDLPSARLTDLMAKLDPDAAKRAAELIAHTDPNDPAAINKLIAEIEPSSTKEKIFEAWQNALLSSPKTAIIKATSDATMLVLDTLAKAASGAMSQGKAIFTGDTPERYALDSWSFAKGAADAIGKAGRTLFGVAPDDLDISFEHRPTYAIKGTVGKIVRIPMTVLSRTTDAVSTLNYAGQLNVLAYRQAIGEGLTGQELEARAAQLASNPTPEMRQAAFDFAKKQTFQADLGNTGKAFQRWIRSTPGLRYLFPFTKTPINIVKAAAEYSPGGLAKGLATGNIDLAGRGAVGSAIASAIAYHTLQGNITGGGPVVPAKKYSLEDSGWSPYSLHIGNRYYSYNRLEPLGMVIGMTADLVHAINRGEDPTSATVESRATQIQEAIMRNIESLPFMYSVSNLMQAFSPDNKNGIRNFISRQAASVVPAVVAQVAGIVDQTVRRPQNVFQRIESRIPELSKNVPAELNVAGEPVKRPLNELGGMNPFPVTTETTDPALREMGRLGETAIHAPKTATEPRRGLHLRRDEKSPRAKLTPEESQILQQQDEQELHAWLTSQMENPEWKQLTPNEKRSAIKKERSRITRSRYDRLQAIRQHGSIVLSGGPTSINGRP